MVTAMNEFCETGSLVELDEVVQRHARVRYKPNLAAKPATPVVMHELVHLHMHAHVVTTYMPGGSVDALMCVIILLRGHLAMACCELP